MSYKNSQSEYRRAIVYLTVLHPTLQSSLCVYCTDCWPLYSMTWDNTSDLGDIPMYYTGSPLESVAYKCSRYAKSGDIHLQHDFSTKCDLFS